MKISFVTNVLNHYQLALSKSFMRQEDIDYHYICTTPFGEERLKLGFSDMNHQYDFSICAYDSEEKKKEAIELCNNSDLLIVGATFPEFYKTRLKAGLLTFMFSERVYKTPLAKYEIPLRYILYYFRHTRFKGKYLLCASAFTAADYMHTHTYVGKAFKWGYFPETKHYNIDELFAKKKHARFSIVWSGRFLQWKHPESVVELGKYLKKKGYNFEINVIGTGELFENINSMVIDADIQDNVHMLGSMSPEKVRQYMEEANSFVFTSDRGEGWGVVLNEAMNSGCAVVASHAIGSVPYLLKHKDNGLIFESKNWKELAICVEELIKNPETCRRYGCKAYRTICEEWNGDIAAKRLIVLADCIKNKKKNPFCSGPCSPADIIPDDWFKTNT